MIEAVSVEVILALSVVLFAVITTELVLSVEPTSAMTVLSISGSVFVEAVGIENRLDVGEVSPVVIAELSELLD